MEGRTANCPKCKGKVTIQGAPQNDETAPSPVPAEAPVAEQAEDHPSVQNSRSRRKETYSPARMKTLIDDVSERREHLVELYEAMRSAMVEQMNVDGHNMLVRGLNQLDNFIDNARRALREAKRAKETI